MTTRAMTSTTSMKSMTSMTNMTSPTISQMINMARVTILGGFECSAGADVFSNSCSVSGINSEDYGGKSSYRQGLLLPAKLSPCLCLHDVSAGTMTDMVVDVVEDIARSALA